MALKSNIKKMHIKKNDVVVAIAGKEAAGKKTGKVLQVLPASGRVVVEGLNFVNKTLRKTQDNPKGGIVSKEASVAASNLLLWCPKCKSGVRLRRERSDKGSLARKCVKCAHSFDD